MARILAVDDNEWIRDLVTRFLADEGHEVATLADGTGVLERVRADPPDLVLLDLFMPDVDGIEVLRALVKLPSRPPVIVMSGGDSKGSDAALDVAAALGADATLQKPFTPEEFLEQVNAALGGAAGG